MTRRRLIPVKGGWVLAAPRRRRYLFTRRRRPSFPAFLLLVLLGLAGLVAAGRLAVLLLTGA
jgi:hypothetical protein